MGREGVRRAPAAGQALLCGPAGLAGQGAACAARTGAQRLYSCAGLVDWQEGPGPAPTCVLLVDDGGDVVLARALGRTKGVCVQAGVYGWAGVCG